MSAAERASEASSVEKVNECAVRVNERANERMAQYSASFHCESGHIENWHWHSIVLRARERVSERAIERTNAAARERSERVSEWCERTSERMSKWLITNRWREIETHTHRNIHTNKSFFFLLFESRELSFYVKLT